MDQTRIGARPAGAAGVFGVREDAQLPAHGHGHAPPVADEPARPRRSWLGIAARLVRNAAVAVAIMTMVPVGIVAFNGERMWSSGWGGTNTRARVAQVKLARSLMLPADPSITPMRAGLAFAALQPPVIPAAHFPVVAVPSRAEPSWRSAAITPDMFANGYSNLEQSPSSSVILERAAAGFSAKELAWLRVLATAPEWRDFDLVARAPAVDFIGGRFIIPFAPAATPEAMPLPRYKSAREMAHAAVSRAAYHLAIGQRDSAEVALRSIVSFGFALVDNGTSLIDELIGVVIVGEGRAGLERFYAITHDPRAGSPAVTSPVRAAGSGSGVAPAAPQPSLDATRRRLIATVADPAVSRGERFEKLRMLSLSSCTNVRELMFGPREDVTGAMRDARQRLARYPSERALLDLVGRGIHPSSLNATDGPIEALAVSSATVAGVVLRNPRLATCTIAAGLYRGLP